MRRRSCCAAQCRRRPRRLPRFAPCSERLSRGAPSQRDFRGNRSRFRGFGRSFSGHFGNGRSQRNGSKAQAFHNLRRLGTAIFPSWTSPVRSRSPARFRNPRPTGVSSFRGAPLGSARGWPHLTVMSDSTYSIVLSRSDKPLVWLAGEIKTPPLSGEARVEAGFLLRRLQRGDALGLPHSRPMPAIGARCHELRITDRHQTWRIVYRADADAIVIAEVFSKKTRATPRLVIENAMRRLAAYDEIV